MFKKVLLFLSYISASKQMFMTPKNLLPFQNNANAFNNATTSDLSILNSPDDLSNNKKSTRKISDDALTIFKIWATVFVFTFPIVSFPYHKEN